MKILLLYYTGTYSTLYITTLIKNQLINKGYEVDVLSVFEKAKVNINKYDYICLGYPIHNYNCPKIVLDKIKKLNIKGKKYLIYKVGGKNTKLNDASSYKLYKYMKKGHNELMGEYHFLMPLNINTKLDEKFIKYQIDYNLKLVKFMINHMYTIKDYKVKVFDRIVSNLFNIVNKIMKFDSQRYKVIKDKCIRCRKCINLCPCKNIEYKWQKRKIMFANKCVNCMRCVNVCPSDAISVGLLNKHKISGLNNFLYINSLENTYDFNNETRKKYLKYKSYFEKIDKLIN